MLFSGHLEVLLNTFQTLFKCVIIGPFQDKGVGPFQDKGVGPGVWEGLARFEKVWEGLGMFGKV